MDSGASLADVRNKNLAVKKKELELIGTRNDLLIEAADAYLGLIKASEKLEASVAAEENTRKTTGQEEIRVQVGSGLASDVLKAKRQLASAQKTVISDEKSFFFLSEDIDVWVFAEFLSLSLSAIDLLLFCRVFNYILYLKSEISL